MDDPHHLEAVAFVIGSLLDSPEREDITPDDIERAVSVASVLCPSVDAARVRGDVEIVLETSGTVLLDPRTRGRRGEIIRGVLR